MTSISLRPRKPLDTLPLGPYTSHALPPSPISIPSKRSITSSPGRQGESSSSKARKVSGNEGGIETIRRKRSDLVAEAKAALSRDEFGTGKSPARRLFVDDKTSFGISGATLAVTSASTPSSPSRRLDFSTTPTNSPGPSNRLAPSPPISSAVTPSDQDNGATVNIHDIGFDIHADATLTTDAGTPDSRLNRKAQATPAMVASLHIPSSPSSHVSDDLNDQENIPPPQQTPSRSSRGSSNTRSPLSKSSISGSGSSARFMDDTSIIQLTGSGRNRIRERSKLNEVLRSAGSDEMDEELTPGRTRPADKGKGKARLSSEVNCL